MIELSPGLADGGTPDAALGPLIGSARWPSSLLASPSTLGRRVHFQYLIVAILLLIIASLGKALYHLSSAEPGNSSKMVKALAWRIGLSVGLFVLLIVAYYQGWIDPQHVR
jgi:hypothetical protein